MQAYPGGFRPCLVAVVLAALIFLAGCAANYESVEVDGVRRDYLLYVPEPPPEEPVPLVLALHQFSDTPRGMRRMTGLDAIAAREGFIVAYPRGRGRRWRSDIHDDDQDTRFLDVLLDELLTLHPVDANRVYATGASAGAMMIQRYACHTDRLAAMAPVMGSITESFADACQPGDALPVLVMHGIEDPVIPYAGGRAGGPHDRQFLSAEATAAFWAEVAGCEAYSPVVETEALDDAVFVRRFAYACSDDTEVLLYAIGGCGHSWPGHKSRYPAFIVGPSVSEPDASEIIWSFFQQHMRGG